MYHDVYVALMGQECIYKFRQSYMALDHVGLLFIVCRVELLYIWEMHSVQVLIESVVVYAWFSDVFGVFHNGPLNMMIPLNGDHYNWYYLHDRYQLNEYHIAQVPLNICLNIVNNIGVTVRGQPSPSGAPDSNPSFLNLNSNIH